MKINIQQITQDGLEIEETIPAGSWEMDTPLIRFPDPVKIKGIVTRITNAITVDLSVKTSVIFVCSRCLEEIKQNIEKKLCLNYEALDSQPIIDLDPAVREELILDYPIKPLCDEGCKGLCLECGENLNLGLCKCKKR
ncbi:MAG: DUF177 domain-containing protein [Candidatus Omnitrophica bacterium]|nr:DUF177 domain-containing protein [Candidatus Omnitrophota bacterium]